MDKKCNVCGEIKFLEEFYKNKNFSDGHASICKNCHKERMRKRAIENKEKISAYHKKYNQDHKEERKAKAALWRMKIQALKTHCIKCGEDRPCVIEFHHVNPSEKSINIGKINPRKSFAVIEEEVLKCVCLCRNCHFEFHQIYGKNPKNPEKDLALYLEDCYDTREVIKYG